MSILISTCPVCKSTVSAPDEASAAHYLANYDLSCCESVEMLVHDYTGEECEVTEFDYMDEGLCAHGFGAHWEYRTSF